MDQNEYQEIFAQSSWQISLTGEFIALYSDNQSTSSLVAPPYRGEGV
jgi:hypothetical protein